LTYSTSLSQIPVNPILTNVSNNTAFTVYTYPNGTPIQIDHLGPVATDSGRTVKWVSACGLDPQLLACFEPIFLRFTEGRAFENNALSQPITDDSPAALYNAVVDLAYLCHMITYYLMSDWCLVSSLHGVNADAEINQNLLKVIELKETPMLSILPEPTNPTDNLALPVTITGTDLKVGYVPKDEFGKFHVFKPLLWQEGAKGKVLRAGTFTDENNQLRCYCVALIYRDSF